MAREYPRFLFSNPTNTKSKGPFIIHTLEPKFIAKITTIFSTDKNGRSQHKYSLLFIDNVVPSYELDEATNSALKWIDAQVNFGFIEF